MESAIHKIFDSLEKFYHEGDVESLLGLFTTRGDLFIWGMDRPQPITSLAELRSVWESEMRESSNDPAAYFRFLNRRIHLTDEVAWVYSDGVVTKDSNESSNSGSCPLMITHILRREEEEWKIVHVHVTSSRL